MVAKTVDSYRFLDAIQKRALELASGSVPPLWNRLVGQHCHIIPGVFTQVRAKHSKSFSLIDHISVGVDRMQRNFEPVRKQVEAWQSRNRTA